MQVFNFITNESKAAVQTHVKQLIASMDQFERKHYENKVTQLDEKIKEA